MIIKGRPLSVNRITYPAWAHGLGWIIVAIPLLLIFGCAIYQIHAYKRDWVSF